MLNNPVLSYNYIHPLSYQRLYFRNANHPIARPSVTTHRQDRSTTNVLLDLTLDKDK